jgi:UDP-N-acetylmuramate--alanine ligase
MSGYARAAHALGATVTGSDLVAGAALERLQRDGIATIVLGHDGANVPAGDDVELVYSSAVDAENPERRAARERGLREVPRAELLSELTALRRTIAVGGTHGKTTTAAMIVHALLGADMDPGWLVGAAPGPDLENARWGEGEWLVVEADESDGSMLSIAAEIALVTNVELDHHTSFASLAAVRELFRAFLAPAQEAIVWDRPELRALRAGPIHTYDANDVVLAPGGSRLRWRGREVALQVPGAHNAVNASGALEAATLAGAPDAQAAAGLERFTGAARRFEVLGAGPQGALIVSDYAHHPTEVAATLLAARTLRQRRVVAVFQPHLFSRTALLAREFGAALALADVAAVLDVYPAR